jgi:predicted Zn-dependent protease DUF2268
MSAIALTICVFLCVISGLLNTDYKIETSDIDNFWMAFDQLESAGSNEDSIDIIQKLYIDRASSEFKKFIRARDFTAEEYILKIGLYPRFWQSIRPLTERIESRTAEIQDVFNELGQALPDYKQPDLCFAIGCLRTGGTTSSDLILIGAEIAAADTSVEKSELPPWLKSTIGTTGGIISMIAHEAIHTQQFDHRRIVLFTNHLLEQALTEGVADFLTSVILGLNINAELHRYGDDNQCSLWKNFESDMESNPKDYSNWLYNSANAKGRPADLGYYIGFKIAEAYYQKQTDKRKAMETLLNKKKYKKVFQESKYGQESCSEEYNLKK